MCRPTTSAMWRWGNSALAHRMRLRDDAAPGALPRPFLQLVRHAIAAAAPTAVRLDGRQRQPVRASAGAPQRSAGTGGREVSRPAFLADSATRCGSGGWTWTRGLHRERTRRQAATDWRGKAAIRPRTRPPSDGWSGSCASERSRCALMRRSSAPRDSSGVRLCVLPRPRGGSTWHRPVFPDLRPA